jgi:rare lipoprotein A
MDMLRSPASLPLPGVRAAVAVAVLAVSAACATPAPPAQPDRTEHPTAARQSVDSHQAQEPACPPSQTVLYREFGTASWFGKEFQGRKTASGEAFDMQSFTAAHRTLPFGATVRVTNLDNFKSVSVRINNRGPFTRSRIIELSAAAARELGFTAQGTAFVKIETAAQVTERARYTVQAASFTEEESADILKERLSKKFEHVAVSRLETNVARLFFVRVGSYASEERAEQTAAKLVLEGLEPVVLRKDQ